MAIARFLDRMCLALRASGQWLCYAAKFDPFLSLDCNLALHPGAIKEKEGIKFCHLATLHTGVPRGAAPAKADLILFPAAAPAVDAVVAAALEAALEKPVRLARSTASCAAGAAAVLQRLQGYTRCGGDLITYFCIFHGRTKGWKKLLCSALARL